MSTVVQDVLPVFLLILIGWLLVKSGYLKAEMGEALGDLVFRVAVPVLLFKTIAVSDFHGASPVRLWVAYSAGVGLRWRLPVVTVGIDVAQALTRLDAGAAAGANRYQSLGPRLHLNFSPKL